MPEELDSPIEEPAQDLPAELLASHVRLETTDQAVVRLQQELDVVPVAAEPSENQKTASYILSRDSAGNNRWTRTWANTAPEYHREVHPEEDSESTELFAAAAAMLKQDKLTLRTIAKEEGRWWVGSVWSERIVEGGLHQAYRIQEGDNKIDILNCVNEDLSEAEEASLKKVFNAVANYTGNKVFDRVAGVVLAPGSEFKDGVAGNYETSSQILRINIDALRASDNLSRYSPYFQDNDSTWFEIVLAHEIGHAMDITSVDEVDAHGLDKASIEWKGFGRRTVDFSTFQKLRAWEYQNIKDENTQFGASTIWRLNDTLELECREYAPTEYARINPKEDFAESFAIASLGGDMKQLLRRENIIADTIQKAEGHSLIGPKSVELRKLEEGEEYPLNRIKTIGMRVFVPAIQTEVA